MDGSGRGAERYSHSFTAKVKHVGQSVYASMLDTLWCNRSRCPTVEPSNARMQNRESVVQQYRG